MFIELTSMEDGEDIWVNVDKIITFEEDKAEPGVTSITLAVSPTGMTTLRIAEEPYKVWARIRAEENR